jgi:subtilisin family serine protease
MAEAMGGLLVPPLKLPEIAQPGQPPGTALARTLARLPTQLAAIAALDSPSLLSLVSSPIATAMDGRLQLAILNQRAGKESLPTSSSEAGEIPVLARVDSVDKWENAPEVHAGATVGRAEAGGTIVTGRVGIASLEKLRADPNVRSLKAAQTIVPNLAATVAALKVAPPTAPPAVAQARDGDGVIVGIVDFGCDFAHRNFRNADGTSRILALWHQAGVAQANSPMGYGRLYEKAEIDAALAAGAAPAPYQALGYNPGPGTMTQPGTHGTHVMDIAAGNGAGTGQRGVAPAAGIIFVDASVTDIAWTGPDVVDVNFGDSAHLLEAIRFIFDRAGDTPCVVNISLGTNGGPHDGTSLVEQGIDAMVNEKPNRAVVIAAANAQQDDIHTSGDVPPLASIDVEWHFDTLEGGEVEIWYPGGAHLELAVIAPGGIQLGSVVGDQTVAAKAPDGSTAVFLSSRMDEPNNHDNVMGVWIARNVALGNWTLRLRNLGNQPVPYHAWIERMDGVQSTFVQPVTTHMLGSISTGKHAIAVGSYDAHKASQPLSPFSSFGPTRDGRQKPEVSAPGGNVLAARSLTGNGVVKKSGTSMAAPAVTGLVALVLARARAQGTPLTIADIRAKLAVSAAANSPTGGWDPGFGAGKVDSSAV